MSKRMQIAIDAWEHLKKAVDDFNNTYVIDVELLYPEKFILDGRVYYTEEFDE